MAPDPSATAARSGSPFSHLPFSLLWAPCPTSWRRPESGRHRRQPSLAIPKEFSPTTSWKMKPSPPVCLFGVSRERALPQDTVQALVLSYLCVPTCTWAASRGLLSVLDQGSASRMRLYPPLGNKSEHLCMLWGAEMAFFGRLAVQQLGCRMLLTLRALNKRPKLKKKKIKKYLYIYTQTHTHRVKE